MRMLTHKGLQDTFSRGQLHGRAGGKLQPVSRGRGPVNCLGTVSSGLVGPVLLSHEVETVLMMAFT